MDDIGWGGMQWRRLIGMEWDGTEWKGMVWNSMELNLEREN